jgi:hypothetical protein
MSSTIDCTTLVVTCNLAMNYISDTASDKFKIDFPNEYNFMSSVTKNVNMNDDNMSAKHAVFAVNVLYKYLKQNNEFKNIFCRIYPKLLVVLLEKQLNQTDYGKHTKETHIEHCESLNRITNMVISHDVCDIIELYIDTIIKRTT